MPKYLFYQLSDKARTSAMPNRQVKNLRKRIAKQAKHKLEMLCAAYQVETNLPASECMLRQQTVMVDGSPQLNLWFGELRADISSAHPDIMYLMDLHVAFKEAFERKKTDKDLAIQEHTEFGKFIEEYYALVKQLTDKYEQGYSATPVSVGDK